MNRLAVINVVGLTEALLGGHTPRLAEFRRRGALARIAPAFPAVTCAAQANYLTGKPPAQHGIVGNGWYDRDLAEVHFWKQSNHLVQAPKIWDALRAPIANRPSSIINRQSLLVVQHVLERGLRPDAAPDLPRRRREDFRHLFLAAVRPRRHQARTWANFRSSVFGGRRRASRRRRAPPIAPRAGLPKPPSGWKPSSPRR